MAAMVDAGLYANLQFPDLSRTEVLGRTSDGSRTSLRLRLAFTGRLDPLGRRLIGSDQLSWIQEIEADTSTGTGRLTFASEDSSRRLRGQADITFHLEHDGTSRQIDGDLVVAVPFVAAAVEGRIIAGLRASRPAPDRREGTPARRLLGSGREAIVGVLEGLRINE